VTESDDLNLADVGNNFFHEKLGIALTVLSLAFNKKIFPCSVPK